MSVVDVKVPSVGESISEVTIASWIKGDGDYVKMDETICEIESDKATFELSADSAGTLKIQVEEGETVDIGAKIAEIDTSAEKPKDKGDKKSGGDQKGKDEGEETDKGDQPDESKEESEESSSKLASSVAEDSGPGKGHPSPAARKILAERGIDSSDIKGTGKGGRITQEDAENASQSEPSSSSSSQESTSTPIIPPSSKPAPGLRETRRQRMSSLRKTIAKRLVAAKNQTAMLTTFNEVDMSAVKQLRANYKEKFKEKYGIGLGFMSFFTKAVCHALSEYPAVNAQIDGDQILFHDYCDIGVAVSTPKGLVVPVIRNAESLSLAEIEMAVMDMATRARKNKIAISEMEGGTFTLSNGGVFGSLMSTPILNAPQSAILGMHKIEDRPVVVDGEIVVRPMMYLALSYDHRIIDGRESVSFLVRVKEYLEDPSRMLLEV